MSVSELDYLRRRNAALTDTLQPVTPSQWAEKKRYLSPSETALPGFYSFDVTPFLREPLDCLGPQSPVRELAFMKGVQLGLTAGLLENAIGYYIEHIRDQAILLLTTDDDLARVRMDLNIVPMLQNSGLDHLIKSGDVTNKRKTGTVGMTKEWAGGGSLQITGARSASRLRSRPIPVLFCDELDGYPPIVGHDGDPVKLARDRTANYEATRKIAYVSTPLLLQTSKIRREYLKGDQRKYMVPCKHCGAMQDLRFDGRTEDGTHYGLEWQTDEDGRLVPGSVRYICKACFKAWTNDDKVWFLPLGVWEPTAKADYPGRRSYHLSALYSPAGMQSWDEIVRKWLECWDVERHQPRDLALLQQFYNNVLGEAFEQTGGMVKAQQAQAHQRPGYSSRMVPNKLALAECGHKIEVLTAAADIHKDRIDIEVVGWCRGQRMWSIDWQKFEGQDCERLDDPSWIRLRELLENTTYKADTGEVYRPRLTLVDSKYLPDTVYGFCADYLSGVFPIQGRDVPIKSAAVKEFQQYISKLGTPAYNVTSTMYKDRLSGMLKREWHGVGQQPDWTPNFPADYPPAFFDELTAEKRVPMVNKVTKQIMGFVWQRPSGSDNHAWDLTVYNMAAIEILAQAVCESDLGLDYVDWPKFWDVVELHHPFVG